MITKNKILQWFNNKIVLFIFAFLLMFAYLFPAKDLIAGSGDATETWKVVTTFLSADHYNSYVMYKGFLTFIPNVIFYQLSLFFKLDHFFFVKLFNCVGFAYITTIGIPYFFAYIFGKKIEYYKIYLSTLVLYFGLRANFSFISVDFPSIMVMILAVNNAIRIKISEKKLSLIHYVYTGIILAMCASFSGQYLPAVFFIVIFLLISRVIPAIKQREINIRFFTILACLIFGFSAISLSNNYFVKTRVQPARDAKEWLPTGSDWFRWALTNNMLLTKYNPTIPDIRGKAILLNENADIPTIEKGGGLYRPGKYAKLVLKYPMDFMMRWLNRLFLGISVDNHKLSFIYLFISYTLSFLALLTMKRKCKKLKDLLDFRTFLILAFIAPSLFMCLMHVEMRYFMSIQILIAGTALFSDTFWKVLLEFKGFLISVAKNKKNMFAEVGINYSLVSYVIFVTLCFMLFSSQYDLSGPIPYILFKV